MVLASLVAMATTKNFTFIPKLVAQKVPVRSKKP
jgi:hypothetical protein